MYVNGKQLGELKHGVGSLGKCASRPMLPDAICQWAGGPRVTATRLSFIKKILFLYGINEGSGMYINIISEEKEGKVLQNNIYAL